MGDVEDDGPSTPRLERLADSKPSHHIATRKLRAIADSGDRVVDEILIRNGFACLDTPADPEGSSQILPPLAARPPAARLRSPRGAALRLELIALAVAQFTGRPGGRWVNRIPVSRRVGHNPVWADLVAAPAIAGSSQGPLDRRARQVKSALDRGVEQGLIHLPNASHSRGQYEHFELLDEASMGLANEEPRPYVVPAAEERGSCLALPTTFFTNGWVNVLEDTEIAVLLMVACGRHGLAKVSGVAVREFDRVQRYGIHRDAFGSHALLDDFGLLAVARPEDPERHLLHRLRLKRSGFDQEAFPKVESVLKAKPATPGGGRS